ncbi:sensor domain-containing protein [Williamsia serinedens]|uniref:PAS domain S-box-containing protein/diguanylate cyclase (GGDEF) domain-containing protein n=1 Tax=Williamsia serinedens TaxID=391736 RepID=A0ABT1H6V4_9NOCA|nr:EAL domain-containing protein [Williamsia serinedens]MCP2162856.1 PAS domain S-box-containing protein/diguanylate cyclase (GGDEF) domain-containing protein [Williamsia serinedens]
MDDDDGRDIVAPAAMPMTSPTSSSVAERYRLLLELSPDSIAVHQAGEIVYVNSAAVRFARVDSPEALIGRPISDFVHPDSLPRMLERITGMGDEAGASTVPEEMLMTNFSGETRTMEVTSVRTVWNDAPAYQVIMRDVAAQKAAEIALRHQAALVDHVSDAVISLDSELRIRSWNEGARRLYGVTPAAAVGLPFPVVVDADVDPQSIVATGGSMDAVHHRGDSGRPILVHLSVTALGDGYLLVGAATRRPLIERLGTIVTSLHQAVVVVEEDGRIALANPAALTILGLTAAQVPGAALDSVHLDFPDDATSPIVSCLRTGRPVVDRLASLTTDAGRRWLSCSVRAIDDDVDVQAALVSIVDITDRHERTSQLAWEANHDFLTGLLNRGGVLRRLAVQLDALSEPDDRVAVFYLDLDNFKLVNDSLGHAAGDEVLQEIARRLDGITPAGSSIGRIGGDEFVIVSPLSSDYADTIERQSRRVHDAVSGPISLGSRSERLTISIGVVVAALGDSRSPTDLLRDADIALYQAKMESSSQTPYVRFRVAHREDLQRRQRIEQNLRSAMLADATGLRLDYQPLVTTTDHRLVAVEALLRWDHPDLGRISPAEFIPIAEMTDLIGLVGDFVVRTATREFTEQSWTGDITLCVNVSRRELTDRSLLSRLNRALVATGLAAERLCVEITESAIGVNDSRATSTVAAVRELGIQVAIDDFGTGASSLNQLYRLPISILKTAKPFVDALDESVEAQAILSSIVAMAHATGMRVVAEGVETSSQAVKVAGVGCDFAQGYYYATPRSLADIEPLARRGATTTGRTADPSSPSPGFRDDPEAGTD